MIIIKHKKLIFLFLCIVIFLLINTYFNKDENCIEKVDKNIEEIDYNETINNLKNEYNNDDVVAILKIDKQIVVPVLQTNDNDYYLKHTIDNKESNLGAIFLDYRVDVNASKKLLIYGHSSTKINMDFNILENYYDEEYYKKHKYISLTTNKKEKIYEIFSIYVETSDFSYMNINFVDDTDYYNHINNLKDKSLYSTSIKLNKDDEILILQTCSSKEEYKEYDKKYLLIISRRID